MGIKKNKKSFKHLLFYEFKKNNNEKSSVPI